MNIKKTIVLISCIITFFAISVYYFYWNEMRRHLYKQTTNPDSSRIIHFYRQKTGLLPCLFGDVNFIVEIKDKNDKLIHNEIIYTLDMWCDIEHRYYSCEWITNDILRLCGKDTSNKDFTGKLILKNETEKIIKFISTKAGAYSFIILDLKPEEERILEFPLNTCSCIYVSYISNGLKKHKSINTRCYKKFKSTFIVNININKNILQ